MHLRILCFRYEFIFNFENIESNGTIFDLSFTPDSFTPANLSVTLPANSQSDAQGVQNPQVSKLIDFRPHRVRETDLLLWWELNSSTASASSNPASISDLQVWFDANDTSTLVYNGSNEISTWRDKSGNGRDATTSLGQPVFNPTGGPGGKPIVEIRRSGGNDALSIGGSAFFCQRPILCF